MPDLVSIRLRAEACQACEPWKTRAYVVGGTDGDRDSGADVMIVGETLGAQDAEGLPFEGAAGRRLNGLLAEAGLDRREAYLTNAVKCRPPDHAGPLNRRRASRKPPWRASPD